MKPISKSEVFALIVFFGIVAWLLYFLAVGVWNASEKVSIVSGFEPLYGLRGVSKTSSTNQRMPVRKLAVFITTSDGWVDQVHPKSQMHSIFRSKTSHPPKDFFADQIAQTPDEVGTIAFLNLVDNKVGRYSDGHDAERVDVELKIVDSTSRSIIGKPVIFKGSSPPEETRGPQHGTVPYEEVKRYINSLQTQP